MHHGGQDQSVPVDGDLDSAGGLDGAAGLGIYDTDVQQHDIDITRQMGYLGYAVAQILGEFCFQGPDLLFGGADPVQLHFVNSRLQLAFAQVKADMIIVLVDRVNDAVFVGFNDHGEGNDGKAVQFERDDIHIGFQRDL